MLGRLLPQRYRMKNLQGLPKLRKQANRGFADAIHSPGRENLHGGRWASGGRFVDSIEIQ
jgi:hypothetical protein